MRSREGRGLPPEAHPKPSVGVGGEFLYDPVSGLYRQGMSRRGFLKGVALGGISVFGANTNAAEQVIRPPLPAFDSGVPAAAIPDEIHVAVRPTQHPTKFASAPVARGAHPASAASRPAALQDRSVGEAPWVREPHRTPAPHKGPDFNFAVLADGHIFGPKNPLMKFRLQTAVRQINELDPQPDFVMYCGDLIVSGTREEFDYFDEIMSELKPKVYYVPGEHDYFLDMGEEFFKRYGYSPFSFDHKGVHIVGLNGVVTRDYWTPRGLTPQQRMKIGGTLTAVNVQGPFMLGREQLDWLERDLSRITDPDTPILVFSHIPLYHYYLPWNLWTEDAPDAHELLKRFRNVQVFHAHVHNLVENRIGHIDFIGLLSTSWPHPYPYTYHALQLWGQMPRSNPALPLDGLGWHSCHVRKGAVSHEDILWTLRN